MFRDSRSLIVAGTALAMSVAPALGATLTWTGNSTTDNTDYQDADNWNSSDSSVPIPRDTDYQDTAVFSSNNPTTVTNVGDRDIKKIEFDTTGWTLGNFHTITSIDVSGNGTNTIGNGGRPQLNQNFTNEWTVASESELYMSSSYYAPGVDLRLKGGGTVRFSSDIAGYSSPQLLIDNATARFEDNQPFSASNGVASLQTTDGILELENSVSGTQSLIDSGEIANGLNGDASQLQVSDIGGGFSRVTLVVPEPTSIALLGLGAAPLLIRRRRGQR